MFDISNDKITITRGDTGKFTVKVYNTLREEFELEYGDEVLFTVKTSTKVVPHLIQKVGPEIVINPEDTKNLEYKTYVYDIQLTLSNGEVHTIISPSDFTVLPEVTFDYEQEE